MILLVAKEPSLKVIFSVGELLPDSGKPVPITVTTTPPLAPRLEGEIEETVIGLRRSSQELLEMMLALEN